MTATKGRRQKPAPRRVVTAVYFDPRRRNGRGEWIAVETRGDLVTHHAHETEEGARRLAGQCARDRKKRGKR